MVRPNPRSDFSERQVESDRHCFLFLTPHRNQSRHLANSRGSRRLRRYRRSSRSCRTPVFLPRKSEVPGVSVSSAPLWDSGHRSCEKRQPIDVFIFLVGGQLPSVLMGDLFA